MVISVNVLEFTMFCTSWKSAWRTSFFSTVLSALLTVHIRLFEGCLKLFVSTFEVRLVIDEQMRMSSTCRHSLDRRYCSKSVLREYASFNSLI